MHYDYKTKDTCSTSISFDMENNVVSNVQFTGGCSGNLKAVASLIDNLTVDEIVAKCSGIDCSKRSSSCAEQLVEAILKAKEQSN